MKHKSRKPLTFDELNDLASKSIELRLRSSIGTRPPADDPAWSRMWGSQARGSHPYVALNDEILQAMRQAGKRCRSTGTDLRASPFWPLLEHKGVYVQNYEWLRPVDVDYPSCQQIHELLVERKNMIRWNGWTARVGALDVADDEYGIPDFAYSYRIYGPAGERYIIPASTDDPSQQVHVYMTGSAEANWESPWDKLTHPAEYSH